MNVFDVGDTVRIGNHTDSTSGARVAGDDPADNAFANAAGVATDPTEVVLRVRKPTSTTMVTTTYRWPTPGVGESQAFKESPTIPEDGHFYVDVVPVDGEGGIWRWWLGGTGIVVAATSGSFSVREGVPG